MNIAIEIERTPNPKALKFILNQMVRHGGKLTLKTKEESENLPLAKDLFALEHVNQVHLFENVITVSHDGEGEWEVLVPRIEAVIQTRMSIHDPAWEPQNTVKPKDRTQLTPDLQKIEEILDRTIRPGLQGDGGDIEVAGFENHILSVIFQGACGGCPSSTMGTLNAIEGILQQEFDPSIRVVPQGMESYYGT
jgi:NFU1 iron-sulfur cluster scaffold homolog, mitochondrial